MLFLHPVIARLPCATCQKYMVNLETGEILRYPVGTEENPVLWERSTPPPCQLGGSCPKESPDREHLHVLSARNARMYDVWRTARAQRRFGCPDALRVAAFRIIDDLVRNYERLLLSREIAHRLKGM